MLAGWHWCCRSTNRRRLGADRRKARANHPGLFAGLLAGQGGPAGGLLAGRLGVGQGDACPAAGGLLAGRLGPGRRLPGLLAGQGGPADARPWRRGIRPALLLRHMGAVTGPAGPGPDVLPPRVGVLQRDTQDSWASFRPGPEKARSAAPDTSGVSCAVLGGVAVGLVSRSHSATPPPMGGLSVLRRRTQCRRHGDTLCCA